MSVAVENDFRIDITRPVPPAVLDNGAIRLPHREISENPWGNVGDIPPMRPVARRRIRQKGQPRDNP